MPNTQPLQGKSPPRVGHQRRRQPPPPAAMAPKKAVKGKIAKRPAAAKDALSLDSRIQLFLDESKTEMEKPGANIDKLPWKKYFDGNQMSALWNRLTSKISADGNDSLKEGWSKVCGTGMRQGKTTAKRNILFLRLKYPDDWQSRAVQFVQKLTKTDTSKVLEAPKTRGELICIHGETEAMELIARGFFEEVDIRGVKHYVKCSFSKETAITKSTEESMALNKSVAASEISELEQVFESFKSGLDLGWATTWGKGMAIKGSGASSSGGAGEASLVVCKHRWSVASLSRKGFTPKHV